MLAEINWNVEMVGTVMALSIPIVAILAGTWSQIERTRSTNELKRSMVERGMSVDEIERVLGMSVRK